jgi:hypothetical protein
MAKSRECLQCWGSQDRGYQNQDRLERMLIGINIVVHAIPPPPLKRCGFLARMYGDPDLQFRAIGSTTQLQREVSRPREIAFPATVERGGVDVG